MEVQTTNDASGCILDNINKKTDNTISNQCMALMYCTTKKQVLENITKGRKTFLRRRWINSKEKVTGLAGLKMPLSESISVCDKLLEGLIQLEKSKTCHNDLKPEKILFNCDQNGKFDIKFSDFGQARRFGGTPGWTSPKF